MEETFLVPIVVANLTAAPVQARITRVQCRAAGGGGTGGWRDEDEWKVLVGKANLADGDLKIDLDPHETRRYAVKLCGHCKVVHAVDHRVYEVATCEAVEFRITACDVTAAAGAAGGAGAEVSLSGLQRGPAKPAVVAAPRVEPSVAAANRLAAAAATPPSASVAPAAAAAAAAAASPAPSPKLAELEATPAGRRVFNWWCSGSRPLAFWLRLARLDGMEALDAKAPAAGGTFLFTHQRDYGMLMWYPDGAYSPEAQGGAWIPGGKTVHSFGC